MHISGDRNDFPAGMVWLVGAGPGDPELLTLKALRLLAAAEVVYYDALVGPDVLAYAPHAELVCVGKRSGRHSKDQRSINEVIVAAALDGRRVVRLKGGDPAIFGRMTEELEALAASGITARICPGITTASAAAASAGVSLTLRGLARKLQFVTAHSRAGDPVNLDWDTMADAETTLAFYMGRGAAAQIAGRLQEAGRAADTPVLIACNVSLPTERLLRTRLDLLPLATATIAKDLPTLIVVGEAVRGVPGHDDPAVLRALAAKLPSA